MENIKNKYMEEKAELLRVVGHPIRLQILSLLENEPKEYSLIASEIKTSKATLVNHLNFLIEQSLIDRLQRGTYEITDDGKILLRTISNIFEKSGRNLKKFRAHLRKQYAIIEDIDENNQKSVSNEPIYQDSWNTFISSTTGVLKSLNVDCDVYEVMGYSGMCFISNCAVGDICTSANKVFSPQTWTEIIHGIESFGWKLHRLPEESQLKIGLNAPFEDEERALKLFNTIKNIIDSYDTPVILFGIPAASYGIIKGYTGKYYSVSTYLSGDRISDAPIRYNEIKWSGNLDLFYFQGKIDPVDEFIRDEEAIVRICEFARGKNVAYQELYILEKGYVSGPESYNAWADALENLDLDYISMYANNYLGFYYQDAKKYAVEFLERLSFKYSAFSQSLFLKDALREYRYCLSLFQEFTALFPYFKFDKRSKFTKKNCHQGAKILRDIAKHEAIAIDYLDETKKKWISSELFKQDSLISHTKMADFSPRYEEGSWNSFIAAISGVLQSYGNKDDMLEIAGRTGFIFLTNFAVDTLRDSSLRIIPFDAWNLITEGVESFGWKLHRNIGYHPRNERFEYAWHIFEKVKRIIGEYKVPVILWGLRNAIYGIVRGYEFDRYIVSTYLSSEKKEDPPIRFDRITYDYWIGDEIEYNDFYYLLEKREILDQNEIDKQAIVRAIKLAEGIFSNTEIFGKKYVCGPNAYDIWKNILEKVENEPRIIFVNSLLAEIYHNAKKSSSMYLKRLADRYSEFPQASFLLQTTLVFQESEFLLKNYTTLFPYNELKKAIITPEKRKNGCEILATIKKHELDAIKYMKSAIEHWYNE